METKPLIAGKYETWDQVDARIEELSQGVKALETMALNLRSERRVLIASRTAHRRAQKRTPEERRAFGERNSRRLSVVWELARKAQAMGLGTIPALTAE